MTEKMSSSYEFAWSIYALVVILCIKEVNGDEMSDVLHVDIITLYNYTNNIIRNVSSDNRNLCAGGVWVGNPG